MELRKLSATSAANYEECPKRWETLYTGTRPAEMPGAPALKGTVCHYALQRLIEERKHKLPMPERLTWLLVFASDEYTRLFADRSEWDDVEEMLTNWNARTYPEYWLGRTVLSTEVKSEFPLATTEGAKPFVYICDRVDLVTDDEGNTDLEVVDYKSFRQPVQPDDMQYSIQVLSYAVAAFIEYGKRYDLKRVTVTYDLLRYDQVSVTFTRDKCVSTWHYLKKLAQRIIDDNEPAEVLNDGCRYCPRRHVCETLLSHAGAGGPLGITDADKAARSLHDIKAAIKALTANKDELTTMILGYCKEHDISTYRTDDDVRVTIGQNKYRGKLTGPNVKTKLVPSR